ncbi:dihydroorotase [Candidatus Falkowbacteria bacterium]|nr:dihydroorotase [Candidatus Falkowbacteria bacterium]
MEQNEITFVKPDDFHAHLRRGPLLKKVLPYSNAFGRVVVMGNLTPPVTTAEDAVIYRQEIFLAGATFDPIMSIMLVRETTPGHIYKAHEAGVDLLKLIPGDTSTGSNQGVSLNDLPEYYPVLKAVEECGMLFSGHWELAKEPLGGGAIREREREARAIPYCAKVVDKFPDLKMVCEHVSTAAMVDFVLSTPDNVGATITAHHMGPYTYGDVFDFKNDIVRPFLYCKPVLKDHEDVEAVIEAALSGNPKFFFGSDSAPHESKDRQPYPAGIFSSPVVIPFLWQLFESHGKSKEDFEKFTSRNGAAHYGQPVNTDTITLVREDWKVPHVYNGIVPFMAGRHLEYKIKE